VISYLLDTNVVLRALTNPAIIPSSVLRKIEVGVRYVSVISFWELLLKSMKRKLDVGDPRVFWAEALDRLDAAPLSLRQEHVATIHSLEPVHRDPFDRALIAQAKSDSLVLVTTDKQVRRYGVPSLYAGV
jgi:PIN domain nuclease of toxin-antitoxin system